MVNIRAAIEVFRGLGDTEVKISGERLAAYMASAHASGYNEGFADGERGAKIVANRSKAEPKEIKL